MTIDQQKKRLEDAKKLEKINPKEGALLADQVRQFARAKKDECLEAEALLRIGRCSYLKGDLERATTALNEGLLLIDGKNAMSIECELNLSMGNTYYYMEIHDQAIIYYTRALDIAKKNNLKSLEAGIYNNIGAIFSTLDDHETSQEYIIRAMKIHEALNKDEPNLSFIYNLSELYYRNKQFIDARRQIDQALDLIVAEEDLLLYAKALQTLALIEHEEGNLKGCFEHMEEALKISMDTKELVLEIDIRLTLANCLAKEARVEEAIKVLSIIVNRMENKDIGSSMLKVYRKLAAYYELNNHKDKSNDYYKMHLSSLELLEDEKKRERVRGIKLHLKLKEVQERTQVLSDSYAQMQIVSEIGQKITARLDLDLIFADIYEDISRLMKVNTLGIGIYDQNNQTIKYDLYMEDGNKMPCHRIGLNNPNSLAAYAVNHDRELIISDMEKEYHLYINQRSSSVGKPSNSAVFVPLKVEDKLIGILTVQSKEKYAYSNKSLLIINTLASYLGIAINNAQKSQELKSEIKNREDAQSSLETLNKKLLYLSEIDGLTNVSNRRYLDQALMKAWKKSLETGKDLSVILLDVDYFKEYNDYYGHLMGDEVLKKVAQILKDVCSDESHEITVARYGGDEFIILLPDTDLSMSKNIAETIMTSIEAAHIDHEKSHILNRVSLSIGIASGRAQNNNYNTLINKGDNALYKAKRMGRNTIAINDEN